MKKKKNNFNEVTLAEFVKNSLMMTMKKLEIIVTQLANLEAQLIGVVTNLQLTIIQLKSSCNISQFKGL